MIGRGRLSGIELLPELCAPAVAWAADALQDRDLTQTDIYKEFVGRLEAIEREHRGELEFAIPSFSAFNRYSIKLATLSSRLNQTREIASTLAEKFDAADSDNLTLIAAEAIKTLIFELLTNSGEGGMAPKEAMSLANALFKATQAQGISTVRRQKVEAEFKEQAEKAVETVAKAKGLTAETTEAILSQILGVKKS
ncbi:DUF3486 family protein [Neorhizobium sp. T786]|uniref:DUF3486 family protein n=1 Tax=Pseudorhizobium xiangyangii TaxID=2883104 RepID=UPI001CFF8BD2|nr:DUF3486 family protein [Neorhizobium xiangyangii]MCB5204241.1 DUF3486 family protein [Neorhizobium xiangyangii]